MQNMYLLCICVVNFIIAIGHIFWEVNKDLKWGVINIFGIFVFFFQIKEAFEADTFLKIETVVWTVFVGILFLKELFSFCRKSSKEHPVLRHICVLAELACTILGIIALV